MILCVWLPQFLAEALKSWIQRICVHNGGNHPPGVSDYAETSHGKSPPRKTEPHGEGVIESI